MSEESSAWGSFASWCGRVQWLVQDVLTIGAPCRNMWCAPHLQPDTETVSWVSCWTKWEIQPFKPFEWAGMMTHGGSIPVLQGLKQEDYHQFKDSLGYTVSSRPCNEWLRKACLWKANCRSRESHSLVGTRPQGRHGKMSGNRVRCRCGIQAQSHHLLLLEMPTGHFKGAMCPCWRGEETGFWHTCLFICRWKLSTCHIRHGGGGSEPPAGLQAPLLLDDIFCVTSVGPSVGMNLLLFCRTFWLLCSPSM